MTEILSQAGFSLADMYDVVGSIAGIDELLSKEVSLVHDMQAQIFSERFRFQMFQVRSDPTGQNTNIDLNIDLIGGLGDSIGRILGVVVVCNLATQMATASVAAHRPALGPAIFRDFPFWIWGGDTFPTRLGLDGTIVQRDVLIGAPGQNMLPSFAGGTKQGPFPFTDIRCRGRTSGFGAGTETVWFLVYVGFTQTDGVSNYGARVPGW